MKVFETTTIMISKIIGADDVIENDYVDELAKSLRDEGLLHPVVVRHNELGGYDLIAGANRLAAAKQLGWYEIRATVIKQGTDAATYKMHVAENLFHKKISKSERAEMLLQWKDAYEAEHPEVRRGYSGAAAKHKLPEVKEPAEPFVEVVEKSTGRCARQTHRDLADAKLLRSFSDQTKAALDIRKVPDDARLAIAKQPESVKLGAIHAIICGDPVEWVVQNFDKVDGIGIMEARAKSDFPESDVGDEEYLRRCLARPADSKDFDVDAILYKRMVKLIQELKKSSKDFLADAKMDKGKGPYFKHLQQLFMFDHPRDWKACNDCSGGKADLLDGKKCPTCQGAKYTIGG